MSATRTGDWPTVLIGKLVDSRHGAELAVGVDVVVELADLHVARRKNQVGVVHRPHHVHQAQLMRFELVRIGVDHDLAVSAAERLRHAGARHAGDLVANLELRQVAKLRLVQALRPLNVTRQTGRLEASNFSTTGGSVPGGKPAQIAPSPDSKWW